MIEHINIKGFRSLLSVNATLSPLTVLIGKNDSGKSSFLEAVMVLAGSTGFQTDHHFRNGSSPITVEALDSKTNTHRVSDQGQRTPFSPEIDTAQYQLPVQGVSMITHGYDDRNGARPLATSGEGVPALLDYFLRRDRDRFFAVTDVVKKHVPGIERLEIGTPDPQQRSLDLVLDGGYRMPADQASSGVRLLLFFIALAYHPTPPSIILLEEPETGIHPKRLADVVSLLREITEGKHGGQPAQVILTTHSPYLLDSIKIPGDTVLVFRRQEDGSRTAESVDAERLQLFLDEFLLGEVWYNEGEEGLIKR